MRPPIVIAEGLDVRLFQTPADAALALEAPDVIDGAYRGYDAQGRRLILRSAGGPSDYGAAVVIEESDQIDARGLAQLLREHLVAVGRGAPPDASTTLLLEPTAVAAGPRQ